jgi:hypothetical protein
VTVYLLIGLGIAILLACGLWLIIPASSGVPWIPTRTPRIRKALQLANLQSGELLMDLGAGDGRVLQIAASEFGAHALGIEIGPLQCLLGWLRIVASGNSDRAMIRWGNFHNSNLRDADVIFIYLTSTQTVILERKLAQELRPGSRVVSISADFPGWQPSGVDREMLIFVYEIPVKPAVVPNYQH